MQIVKILNLVKTQKKKTTKSFHVIFHDSYCSYHIHAVHSLSSFPRNLFTHRTSTATSISWETHEYQMDSNRAMALHTKRWLFLGRSLDESLRWFQNIPYTSLY